MSLTKETTACLVLKNISSVIEDLMKSVQDKVERLSKDIENWAFFKHNNKILFFRKAIKRTMSNEIAAIFINLFVVVFRLT